MMNSLKELRFCYNKEINFSKNALNTFASYAVALKGKYWNPGYTLKIYFINGSDYQHSQMIDVIDEILGHINLKAEYTITAEGSDIRISFNYGMGSYSYMGTDAKFIPSTKETLNIGWSGKPVMRHEFCHALNLAHEHQNPNGGITWDEQAVIKSLSGPPNSWSEQQIRSNVLDKYNLSDVDSTKFDKDSIMLYYFPNDWTIGDFETNENQFLSKTDIKFLQLHYPPTDTIKPVIKLNGDQQVILKYGQPYIELGATAIDNVDGILTDKIQITGTVDSKDPGIHPIKYSVMDSSMNKSEIIRNVLVEEKHIPTEPPVVKPDPSDPEQPPTGKPGCAGFTGLLLFIISSLILYLI